MSASGRPLLWPLALMGALLLLLPASVSAATFTVDSTGDQPDRSPGDGTCADAGDPAQCTLRAALMEANRSPGADEIRFEIGVGAATISPATALPPITEEVDVNGTFQPGWAGTPLIELTGRQAPFDADGLRIDAGTGSTIRGLIVNSFRIGIGIEGAGGNTVMGNWIGTNSAGTGAAPNLRSGVYVFDSPGNVIGGTTPSERNVISGNGLAGVSDAEQWGKGIEIFGGDASGNRVIGNYVGTDVNGSAALPNLRDGVWIGSGAGGLGAASDTEVGDGSLEGRNVVSGNGNEGVQLVDAERTAIRGNLIGLGVDGSAIGNGWRGISVESAPDTRIGGTDPGDRNVVSANGHRAGFDEKEGIIVYGPEATRAVIEGNYIGTNIAGDAIRDASGLSTGNAGQGISLTTRDDNGAATDARVGGNTSAQRNVISGNAFGVSIINRATGNRVTGNYIGTDRTGAVALGNGFAGVILFGADDNVIGGTASGLRNVISGNAGAGVRLEGSENLQKPATGNRIQGNFIGVAPDGSTPVPNGQQGILFFGRTSANVVGYELAATDTQLAAARTCDSGACNRVMHNGNQGVWVLGDLSVRNTIRGNRVTSNGSIGIDLGPGNPTPDDLDDADTGANDLLNFPVGVTHYRDPETAERTVSGRILGPSPELLKVDIYTETWPPDPIGAGEGRTWEGSVTPDDTGSFVYPLTDSAGAFYSATATDPAGNTSEFSPVCGDPDGNGDPDDDLDALCDDWEVRGIDFDFDRAMDLRLGAPPFSADPTRKDLFVEADHMGGGHEPQPATMMEVENAFADSGVDMGRGIALHVTPGSSNGADEAVDEVDELLTHRRGPGDEDDFVDLRDGDPDEPCDGHLGTASERADPDRCWKTLGARALAFRYAIFGQRAANCPNCVGVADGGGDNLFVGDGWVDATTVQRNAGGLGVCLHQAACLQSYEAATFMHELGHTLGLGHGGKLFTDDGRVLYKPNFLSIMNLSFDDRDVIPDRPLDFSRWELPALDEARLVEARGIDGDRAPLPERIDRWHTTWYPPLGSGCFRLTAPAMGDLDWNGSGPPLDMGPVSVDINRNCEPSEDRQTLKGHDDWSNLHFSHRDLDGWNQLKTGETAPNQIPEQTVTEKLRDAERTDFDGDGVNNTVDNCNTHANAGQDDGDGDGIGDACQAPRPKPPVNTAAPTIDGEARDGEFLTARQGTWTGTGPFGYEYLWFACDSGGANCAAAGAGTLFRVDGAHVGMRIKVRETATNAADSVSADSALTPAVAPVPVSNLRVPLLSGTPADGEVMHTDAGVWRGTQPIAYEYQWRRCDEAGSGCVDIAGASQPDYTVGPDDTGRRLRARVTATNRVNSGIAESPLSAVVGAVPPTNTSLPVISGTPQVGQSLTTSLGSWQGTEPMAFAIEWLRCDPPAATCRAIPGASAASYTLGADELGQRIKARVTATNTGGSVARESAPTAVVAAAGAGATPGTGAGSPGSGPFGPLAAPDLLPDTAAPVVTAKVRRTRLRRLRRRGLAVIVGCSEPCEASARLVQARPRRKRGRRKLSVTSASTQPALPADKLFGRAAAKRRGRLIGRGNGSVSTAGGKTTIVVRLTRRARRRLRSSRRLTASLSVIATDAAGNAATTTRRMSARR